MDYVRNFSKSQLFKNGLPFFILIVGGSFAFRNFTTLRYDFSKSERLSPEEKHDLEKLFKKPNECDIDAQYEKYKEINIEDWNNKRIPRPWDEEEHNKQSS